MKKDLVERIVRIAVTYVLLLAFVFGACYLYLFEGVAGGDDVAFHLGNIFDTYYGMTKGLPIDSTNHLVLGAYAYNTHLYYAPLPHYFAAIMMAIFQVGAIEALKISIFFFSYIGVIFFYHFALKATKSYAVSIVAAAIYLFCPYHMFCSLCRFAYAETIAMSLLPVLFFGVYAITHDEKPKFRSFLAVILGVSGLVLSHPYTALTASIFALIYMAVRFKAVFGFLKTRKGLLLTIGTVVGIFGLIGFYFFPMLQSSGDGLHRISDPIAVWTTFDHVSKSTANSWQFSGFFNLSWIEGRIAAGRWPSDESPASMVLGVGMLLVSAILVAICDHLIKKAPKSVFYRYPVDIVVAVLPVIFVTRRIEVYIGLGLYLAVFFFTRFISEKHENRVFFHTKEKNLSSFSTSLVVDAIYLIVSMIVVLLYIFIKDVWSGLPSIFYSGQFAWRLWSVFAMLFSWFLTLVLHILFHYKNKIAFTIAAAIPFLLFASSQCYPEKRVVLTYPESGGNIYVLFGEDRAKTMSNLGAMNEYIPNVFYDNEYVSEYPNSLYGKVKATRGNYRRYIYDAESYFDPAFLEGKGNFAITALNTPNATFSAHIEEEALVQIPQYYYRGYEITFADSSGTITKTVEGQYVDGLVAFEAPVGDYEVNVVYKGPKIRRVFNVVFFITASAIASLAVFSAIELIKEKKEEWSEKPAQSSAK